ncbi:MAG: hypothetical protein KUG79_00200 [Pseudomonadales bacterium]|nr:hypothetical protein [Pseudomonadales bacterium]
MAHKVNAKEHISQASSVLTGENRHPACIDECLLLNWERKFGAGFHEYIPFINDAWAMVVALQKIILQQLGAQQDKGYAKFSGYQY